MRLRLSLLLLALSCASVLIGARQMEWRQLFSMSGDAWLTLTASRLPRLAALVLTGVGLSVCGVILQHIVRNRFVEPGTSGGLDAAKLGILVSLTLAPAAGVASRMLFALAFCFAASMVYVAIIRRIKFRNTVLVPVVGLMYGSVLSAVAEFYAYRHNILQSMQGWLLGDFSRVVQGRYEILYLVLPVVALAYLYAHRFTVLGMGEEMAASLGLGYAATAAQGLVLVAVTVSASVIVVGAIPFIGLVVPNLVAMRHGENLGRTLPIVALGGASLLLACDIVGRLLMYPFEVPIGLTAGGVGGVLFLILILRGCDEARLPSVADPGGGGRAGGGVRARGFGPGFRLRDPEAAGPAGRHRRRRRLRGVVGHRVPDAGEQPHPDARHHGLRSSLPAVAIAASAAGRRAGAGHAGRGGGFIVSLLLMLAYSWGIHRWLLRGGRNDVYLLLLVGLVLTMVIGTFTQFVQLRISPGEFAVFQGLSYASFNRARPDTLLYAALAVAAVCLACRKSLPVLDVLALGREQSLSLGVDHPRHVRRYLALIAVLVAVSTSLIGPTAFMGIFVANIAYALAGSVRHRIVLPLGCAIAIAIFLAAQLLVEHVFNYKTTVSILVNLVCGAYFLALTVRARGTS